MENIKLNVKDLKVNRTYNHMYDASYINFEIVTNNQQLLNANGNQLTQLMVNPTIKNLCYNYLMDTLPNRAGIIKDYWLDGNEKINMDFDGNYIDMVYDQPLEFIKEFKEEIDQFIKFSFDNSNIKDEMVNWGITFIKGA